MRRRSILISQSSGSGVPADALGNLGDRYFDTTASRWYLKRWVGNFNSDKAELSSQIFGGTGDWELEFLMKSPTPQNDIRFVSSVSSLSLNAVVISGQSIDGAVGSDFYGAGYAAKVAGCFGSVWHKLRFLKTGNVYQSWKDGVAGSQSTSTSAIPATTFIVGGGGLLNPVIGMMANIKASGYAKKLAWEFNEGSGMVATDSSGSGLNGVITDNAPTTFWAQSWVPMDLL